ncbi:MAG TPA: hypothetical protein P5260_08380 [Candidatus Competibacter sp.]|jgi:septation ring formation regulator EzrA|nr:hypothetical protein [Candidatus Competibacter sp.]
MRSISERDLSVVIPILAAKIHDLNGALNALDANIQELDDEKIDEKCNLQETIEQYYDVLEALQAEYESALAEGINLPSYEQLIQKFELY